MNDPAATGSSFRKWWILGACGACLGIVLLDETVVAVALPTIQKDLGLSDTVTHWVISAYLIVFAALAAVGGKLGDIFGLKVPFMIALTVFALASAACGFSTNGHQLIAARAAQGIGGAVLFPISMAMVTASFPDAQRGLALGIYGSVGTAFLALGPLVGGLVTHYLSWNWIFWINPVVCIAIGLVLLVLFDRSKVEKSAPFDLGAVVTLVPGLVAVVFALMQGPDWGWSDARVWGAGAVGIVLLVLFSICELRTRFPLIDVRLFSSGHFTICNLAVFLAQWTKTTLIVFGALYLQSDLGMSASQAGVALMLSVFAGPFTGGLYGSLTTKIGPRPLIICGLFLTVVAFAWLGFAGYSKNFWLLAPGLIVNSFSTGMIFQPPRIAIMAEAKPESRGQIGGVTMTSQLLGGAAGMAFGSIVYTMFGGFEGVMFGNALFALALLVFGFFALKRR